MKETAVSSGHTDPEPTAGETRRCASCGHPLSGRFCSACGEETVETHELSLKHFFGHSVVHEFAHVDGKIVRTLRSLLLRPGFLTCEYFAGRRTPYVNPLRLLLTSAILFALLAPPTKGSLTVGLGWPRPFLQLHLSMLPPAISETASIEENIKKVDVADILTNRWRRMEQSRPALSGEATAEKFNRLLESFGEFLAFCSVIPIALLTWLIYRRRRPYLVEHLVFALHLEAFLLILGIAVNSISELSNHLPRPVLLAFLLSTVIATYLAQAWYLQSSLIRFFELNAFRYRYRFTRFVAWKTAFIGLVLFLVNSLFLSIVHTVGAAIALWRL